MHRHLVARLRCVFGVGDHTAHLAQLDLALQRRRRAAASPPRPLAGSARRSPPARSAGCPSARPTCSPLRTPIDDSPRTTPSTRRLTSALSKARSSKRKHTSSGARLACSSSTSASERRVSSAPGAMRARRGSWTVPPSRAFRARAGRLRDGRDQAARTRRCRRLPPARRRSRAALGAARGLGRPGRRRGPRAADARRLAITVREPARPGGDYRPRVSRRLAADHEAEVPGGQRYLVDVGDAAPPRGSAARTRAARSRRPRRRSSRIGESMSASVTSRSSIVNPPLQHAVVRHELAHELGQRGTRPGHPAFVHQEPALALARQQRLAVESWSRNSSCRAQRLDGVQHPEAGAGHPARHAPGPRST